MYEINAANRLREMQGSSTPLFRPPLFRPQLFRPQQQPPQQQQLESSSTSECILPDFIPDFIPWDTGMGLPYLPYSFTCTCALCGKTKVAPDSKNMMPLTFLRELLCGALARTPFVYNVLYQMAFFFELEQQHAERWSAGRAADRHPAVPLCLRGRVTFCLPCARFVKERACQGTEGAGAPPVPVPASGPPDAPPPSGPPNAPPASGPPDAPDASSPAATLSTEEALRISWEDRHDHWRMLVHRGPEDQYQGEVGRKMLGRAPTGKVMLPMDLLFHMLHLPSPKRIPEYRMTTRLLKTLAYKHAVHPLLPVQARESHSMTDHQDQEKKMEEELQQPAAALAQQQQLSCLYLYIPSIPLHTLLTQVRSGAVQLRGALDKGTISNRMHLSAYLSGGKRRVSRADQGVACTIRKASHLLRRCAPPPTRASSSSARKGSCFFDRKLGHGNWIGAVPWVAGQQ